jgi:hypothetical protein
MYSVEVLNRLAYKIPQNNNCIVKGTVTLERLKKFGQKFTELGLNKGWGWFLNFPEATLIFNDK